MARAVVKRPGRRTGIRRISPAMNQARKVYFQRTVLRDLKSKRRTRKENAMMRSAAIQSVLPKSLGAVSSYMIPRYLSGSPNISRSPKRLSYSF